VLAWLVASQTDRVDREAVAAAFGLGDPTADPVAVPRGWGGDNIVYRLQTTTGTWAVKELVRELDDLTTERFDIETRAFEGGVAMARPVPAPDGSPIVVLDGVRFRCHEWFDGLAKANEDTVPAEAQEMGRLVGRLHGLALSWSPRFDEPPEVGEDPTWLELTEAARARSAPWASTLAEYLAEIEDLAKVAGSIRHQHTLRTRIGSHRDLNAHNVLFGHDRLALIDWDAAGPVWPPWERANYATL
jgi:Ser/Thr protein kinase RdoA (MazF antagonist)